MKVLVTGAKGQLGRSVQKIQSGFPDIDFTFTDVEELDITDPEALKAHFSRFTYDRVLNCAAYTAVDKAENDSEMAHLINDQAVANLARCVEAQKSVFIHISTDYVFSGRQYLPYREADPTDPESVYGKSKAAGELSAMQLCERTIIVRTGWLYSEFGHNFLKTMLRLGDEKESLNVVIDQAGTPTYARDLAEVLLKIMKSEVPGSSILHYSNEGLASWYDFAWEIMHLANKPCRVRPILTKDYPLPAPRPPYCVMNKEQIRRLLKVHIPHWKESLKDCLSIMGEIH